MDETPVVTAFLRNGAAVLLLRRSDAVGSYAGRWGAVAGHVAERGESPADADPDAAARREIAEETGLDDAVTLVRRGDPFPVEDAARGTRWLVHPYLFDCDRRGVESNAETAAHEWVHPTAMLSRETVPDLWRSYDAVRPTVETVRADETHGSAYLSLRAVEVLRDAAGAAAAGPADGDWNALAATARDLRDARPAMTAPRVRVDRTMATADDRTPAAVETSARSVLDAAVDAEDGAAAAAADRLGGTVATLSRSGTVRAALRAADVDRVVVSESRPGGEGLGVAESLAGDGVDVTLTTDAALPGLLDGTDGGAVPPADAVAIGADTVLPDGAVVNKVGTYPLALAAARSDVPVYAVCAADKVRPDAAIDCSDGDPADIYGGAAAVDVANPVFEVTPADLVTAVVTEDGVLDADGVAAAAAAHRELARWVERGETPADDADRETQ
jgi:translation initiation factor 2B subunit (eIF-2B alpha/beta/delta family)